MPCVLDEQRLDVVDVPAYLGVVGAPAQVDQGAGDDVDEAPGEFLERRRVALGGQLVGDARGDLGHPAEVADGVVTCRQVRVAEVEHEQVTAGAPRLGIHPAHQVGIPFGIEHDHRVTTTDVLGDQDLCQARLADPRGAEYQRVAVALIERHPDILFVRLDRMQLRFATDRRGRAQRIEQGICRRQAVQPAQYRRSLPRRLVPAYPARKCRVFEVGPHLGPQRIAQALRVLLTPGETAPEKQPARRPGDLVGAHPVTGQGPHVALVAQYAPGLAPAMPGQPAEQERGTVSHPRCHEQCPGGQQADRRTDCSGTGRPGLDRGTQQGLDRVDAHCSIHSGPISTG